jgi:outer membrane lipoprotein carrier protein
MNNRGESSTALRILLFLVFAWMILQVAPAADLDRVVDGLQRRYSAVNSIQGNFQQTYRAPGIEQVESGQFRLKRPGLMRWEYQKPEEKLFVADGKDSYLFLPQDRQVTVQPYRTSDLHSTPLEFLLGAADISGSFQIAWETQFKPRIADALLVRLTPRKSQSEYSSLALALDPATYEIRAILIRESSGNTSEFLFSNVATNVRLQNKFFQFKPPKGVEVVRLTDSD